jgi:Neutral/alkaline non-lysosomal ceramidase, N-terminal
MRVKNLLQFSCLLGVIALQPVMAQRAAPDNLRAGAAKVDITPPVSALLHGDTIRDPLYVRAIVISNGASCAVLIGVEQGNFETPISDDATQRASRSTGCPASNFIISATHTHSGNTGGLNNSGSPTPKQVGDAMVSAIEQANAKLKPARIGYGTTQVNLNVNRDLFEGGKWYQGNNREGPSDKTLAVVELLDEDDLPIGVYMNYAMHPINFYLSGLISADFPGEASRYIERRFPNSVAVFTQGASGNQNPLLDRPFNKLASVRTRMPDAHDDRLTSPDGWKAAAQLTNANVVQTEEMNKPIKAAEAVDYKDAVAQTSEIATAEGALIAESAIDVMKNLTPVISSTARLWSGQETFSCPGRDRLDNTARQGTLPPYKDGAPVNIRVGLLRIGDIYFASVNGEVYSEIATRLKKEAPSNKLMMITLANGRANSGYIYSNEAAHHLTFQVIGSRLKPGCAEDKIVGTVLSLFNKSDTSAGAKD